MAEDTPNPAGLDEHRKKVLVFTVSLLHTLCQEGVLRDDVPQLNLCDLTDAGIADVSDFVPAVSDLLTCCRGFHNAMEKVANAFNRINKYKDN